MKVDFIDNAILGAKTEVKQADMRAEYHRGYLDGLVRAREEFVAWVGKGSGDGIGAEAEAYIGQVGKPLTPSGLPETRAIECAKECYSFGDDHCDNICSLSAERQAERDAVNAGAAEFGRMVNGE